MPNFNIGGYTQINTIPGGFLSIMILGITICYGVTKFIDMYKGNDPNVLQNLIPDSFGLTERLNFSDDINFRLALGIRRVREDYSIDSKLFHEPRIVKWIARMTSVNEKGVTISTNYPMHDCTE